ncbi:tRNA (cytosine(34)-C(5))-methyltransferase, mitochondrial isoform X2 [Protopterus annectens]|nr:tRNA (cytosine(34)-C(5))-methyltransferase, mitochondrial isoform X2 [Protopterus annectens]
MLSPSSWQYAVMLNRFSFSEGLEAYFQNQGLSDIFHDVQVPSSGWLKCYVSRIAHRYPAQRHQQGRLKDYYLLNAASLLPVLALEVEGGNHVLDMCAAPGGKSLAILQYAMPGNLVCNEPDCLRRKRLKEMLESFLPELCRSAVTLSNLDGREFGQLHPEVYDKVLVDAPCSNDRSWLFTSDIPQARHWIASRKELPVLQVELIRSGIAALRPGGILVYSTCTLSQSENSNVVDQILQSDCGVELQNLDKMAHAFSDIFTFSANTQYGLLVLPDRERAWGPMYVARFKKRYPP